VGPSAVIQRTVNGLQCFAFRDDIGGNPSVQRDMRRSICPEENPVLDLENNHVFQHLGSLPPVVPLCCTTASKFVLGSGFFLRPRGGPGCLVTQTFWGLCGIHLEPISKPFISQKNSARSSLHSGVPKIKNKKSLMGMERFPPPKKKGMSCQLAKPLN
jgi:hypothetical protein